MCICMGEKYFVLDLAFRVIGSFPVPRANIICKTQKKFLHLALLLSSEQQNRNWLHIILSKLDVILCIFTLQQLQWKTVENDDKFHLVGTVPQATFLKQTCLPDKP